MSRRTSLKLTDERERQLEKAGEIVANNPDDDPPMSVVIDAGLAHLVESKENLRPAPTTTILRLFRNCVTHLFSVSSTGRE